MTNDWIPSADELRTTCGNAAPGHVWEAIRALIAERAPKTLSAEFVRCADALRACLPKDSDDIGAVLPARTREAMDAFDTARAAQSGGAGERDAVDWPPGRDWCERVNRAWFSIGTGDPVMDLRTALEEVGQPPRAEAAPLAADDGALNRAQGDNVRLGWELMGSKVAAQALCENVEMLLADRDAKRIAITSPEWKSTAVRIDLLLDQVRELRAKLGLDKNPAYRPFSRLPHTPAEAAPRGTPKLGLEGLRATVQNLLDACEPGTLRMHKLRHERFDNEPGYWLTEEYVEFLCARWQETHHDLAMSAAAPRAPEPEAGETKPPGDCWKCGGKGGRKDGAWYCTVCGLHMLVPKAVPPRASEDGEVARLTEEFVRAALALRGHVSDPEHSCKPEWSKVIEFDRAFLAMRAAEPEMSEAEAQQLYQEAAPGARPFTATEVARLVQAAKAPAPPSSAVKETGVSVEEVVDALLHVSPFRDGHETGTIGLVRRADVEQVMRALFAKKGI